MRVVSVNIGEARPDPRGRAGRQSGIFKEPVERLLATPTGAAGDAVCDTRYHGEPSKALCVYCGDHFDALREIWPDGAWSPGAMGENLTVGGLPEDEACLGDIFEVGEATLQITQPRGPCATLSARHGLPELPKVLLDRGFTGWYMRVLAPGTIRPGDALRRIESHPLRVSIHEANAVAYAEQPSEEGLLRLLAVDALSDAWREMIGEMWAKQRASSAR